MTTNTLVAKTKEPGRFKRTGFLKQGQILSNRPLLGASRSLRVANADRGRNYPLLFSRRLSLMPPTAF
jgi:hypothetical protein